MTNFYNQSAPARFFQDYKPIPPSPKPETIPRIKSCPVCTASFGIIELPISLITAVAEAVYEKLEWAIILEGERISTNHVRIHDWFLPDQTRRVATVDINDLELTPTTMGVLHSHHSMQANFSGTDINELNPFYPVSIVAAQHNRAINVAKETYKELTERIFGWTFSAVGTVILPCGSLGEVRYDIVPYDEEDGSQLEPWRYEPQITIPTKSAPNLSSTCVDYTSISGENFTESLTTACGIISDPIPAKAYWGRTDEILTELDSHDEKFASLFKKSKQKEKTLLTPLEETTIIPLSLSLDSIEIRKQLTMIEAFGRAVNKQLVSGITVPTKLDNINIASLSSLINRLRANHEVALKSEISTPLRLWFEQVLDFDQPLSSQEFIELISQETIAEALLFNLTELHRYLGNLPTVA